MNFYAVGRFLRSARHLVAACTLATLVAVALGPLDAQAAPQAGGSGDSGDQQQRVSTIIDELDRLGQRIDQLDETYAQAVNDQEDLIIEIGATEKRIEEKENELAAMQKDLRAVAMKSFVSGGMSNSLSSILSSTNGLTDGDIAAF